MNDFDVGDERGVRSLSLHAMADELSMSKPKQVKSSIRSVETDRCPLGEGFFVRGGIAPAPPRGSEFAQAPPHQPLGASFGGLLVVQGGMLVAPPREFRRAARGPPSPAASSAPKLKPAAAAPPHPAEDRRALHAGGLRRSCSAVA